MSVYDKFYKPLQVTESGSTGIFHLPDFLDLWKVNLNPTYQRDYVWEEKYASQLVGHLLEGGSIPPIFLNKKGNGCEVLDGKQRLTSILKFISGEIPALLESGDRIYFSDLSKKDRKLYNSRVRVDFKFLSLKTGKEVLQMYLKLNRAVPHTEEELDRVRSMLEML